MPIKKTLKPFAFTFSSGKFKFEIKLPIYLNVIEQLYVSDFWFCIKRPYIDGFVYDQRFCISTKGIEKIIYYLYSEKKDKLLEAILIRICHIYFDYRFNCKSKQTPKTRSTYIEEFIDIAHEGLNKYTCTKIK